MFKIVAEEQGWLDRFNDYFGVEYKNGQLLEDNEVDDVTLGKFNVKYAFSGFNKTVAQGEAIWLEKVNADDKIVEVDIYTFGGMLNLKMKVENTKKLINEFKSSQNLEIMISGKGYGSGTVKSVIYKLVVDGKEISKDWDKIIDDVDVYIDDEKLEVEK